MLTGVSPLPRAALFSIWVSAWLRGEVSADDLGTRLDRGHDDAVHVVIDLPQEASAQPLLIALGALRRRGASAARLALPAPGDPVGLAGPAAFNIAALDARQAVVLDGTGLGLIPAVVGRAVEWCCLPATPPAPLDPGETAAGLHRTLLEVTSLLTDLDVATWQPEIPDALMNLRHRPALMLPASYDERRRERLDRALLCLEIVTLARGAGAAMLAADQAERRRRALDELDRAARRGLVALSG
jgi:hypothetical protein